MSTVLENGTDRTSLWKLTRIAALVSTPIVIFHLLSLASLGSKFGGMYDALGADLPFVTRLLLGGPFLVGLVLLLFDLGIFAVCYLLARKTWQGFVFLPIAIYLALPSFFVFLIYQPSNQIFDLIK